MRAIDEQALLTAIRLRWAQAPEGQEKEEDKRERSLDDIRYAGDH